MSKTVEVKDQKTADALKNIGIDAVVKGQPASDDAVKLKEQVDTLTKAITEKDVKIAELEKGTGTTPDALSKAIIEKLDALGVTQKFVVEQVTEVTSSVGDMVKSVTEAIATMKGDIDKIATETDGRKSTSGGNGASTIKKAFEVDAKSGKKRLSKAIHGREIDQLLGALSESNDANKELYTDAAMRFEASREITKSVLNDLNINHDIEIVD